MENRTADVAAHYAHPDLIAVIDAGLDASGVSRDRAGTTDLAPVDEFHTLGRTGTIAALDLMNLSQGARVLDAGSGLGGPARVIAAEYGCTVDGIDVTPDYVAAARELTRRQGLSQDCRFTEGSVTDLPFENATFDAAITFHVGMNVADRDRFYAEVARVLKPAGMFCVFDVMKGPAPGVPYPMPWSETEARSHIRTRDETVAFLEAAGFEIVAERNLREEAVPYYRKALAETEKNGPGPLGLHLLTGANAGEKFANILSAYEAGQIEPVILVARKR
ncbi:class I SAM-dependent methyltransferase [Pelagibacterium xiamenense]|uniref:class I SAM-dependent methyltransferase n=1 Tax=Pelagibacterium xiamenense TaxID=2901140 RepID=UPI001E4FE345|nr:class I SAM-dependent methyltransferase [Pelagibacterium xiamenense]MCD7060962.1 class I SAM-dependent methyltransferase [Pelagibacterium xiamenense]